MAEDTPDAQPARSETGVVEGIRIDLSNLHAGWMALAFPRQRRQPHSVLGKWRPRSTLGRARYWTWGVLGAVLVGTLYPFVLLGFATRFYSRRIDRTAASLGFVGVVVLSLLVWGALTALVYLRNFSAEGVAAVAAAGSVATVSAVLALVFSRIDGRPVTVLLAYPFGVTALFLPPVVAALFSPTLADYIFPRSTSLAIWLLDNVLWVGELNTFLRETFELEGLGFVAMWFGLAFPVGWVLGTLVTLANVARPSEEEG